jgi:hypothetical protein
VRLDSQDGSPQLTVPRPSRLSSPPRFISTEINRFLRVRVYLLMDELFEF